MDPFALTIFLLTPLKTFPKPRIGEADMDLLLSPHLAASGNNSSFAHS